MNRVSPRWGLLAALTALVAAPAAHSDALRVVQMLRAGGCGGIVPIAPPLRHDSSLDRLAQAWADGHSLAGAQGLRVRGPDEAIIREQRRVACRMVSSRDLSEVGIYHRGADTYLVLATATASPWSPAPAAARRTPALVARAPAPTAPPPVGAPPPVSAPPSAVRPAPAASTTPALAARALQLINEARARGAHCGAQSFGPAPPLTLSGTLASVALGHAADMAVHDYFEHQDLSGLSPADRVRAAGYQEKLVGENIAYGPKSVEEVVQGWLASPDHCENIMDPRFAQMGIGLAPGRASRRGLFWVQLLAEPRA